MTTQPRHPAPGSDVPGAPPALRRELTTEDGVTMAAPTAGTPPTTSVMSDHRASTHGSARPERPASTIDRYLTALGLISVAVAIEVGTRRTRSHSVHRAAHKEIP